jgi:hypothetical protein
MLALLPVAGEAREVSRNELSTSKNLYFLENKGQVTDQAGKPRTDIQFSVPSDGMNVFIGNGQIHYQFSKTDNKEALSHPGMNVGTKAKPKPVNISSYRMDVSLVGADMNAPFIAENKQDYVARYYKAAGAGRNLQQPYQDIEAHSYKKVTYKNVYHNIDWVIFIKGNELEYEFIVRPGGNPADIKLRYDGTTALNINRDGSLTATTPMGTVTEKAPVSFQENGTKVASSFSLNGNTLSFNVGKYDGTLIIDPTLTWGTYFGSTGLDVFYNITTTGFGDIYAVGYTQSAGNLATTGAAQTTNAGLTDVLLAKFSASGTLLWSTFYGTTADDYGYAVTATATEVFLAGGTDFFGDENILIGKFTSAGALGSAIAYGDIGNENGFGIVADGAGNVYVTGATTSSSNMTSIGAHQATYGGVQDGFIAKFANSLSVTSNLWFSYYGGTGWDAITALAIDASSNVYVSGTSGSSTGIATLAGSLNGAYDGFIAKFNTAGVRQFGTYIGGNGIDEARAIALDGPGNIFIAGQTSSTLGLATTGAYQSTNQGGTTNLYDGFLAKYNSAGAKQWATFYGGPGDEFTNSILVYGTEVIMGGYTESTTNIASPGNAWQAAYGGGITDAYMAKFNSNGARLWGTYYGGSAEDDIFGMTAGPGSDFYISGASLSASAIATSGAVQTTHSGAGDGFLSRFTDCVTPAQPATLTGSTTICQGTAQTYTITAIAGATSYTWTLPAGFTGTSTTNTINVTAGLSGGIISVQANNACGSGAALNTTITVTPIPVATISAAGPTTFCQGGNVTLNATTGTGLTYQWQINTINIPGATNASYVATAAGNYTVTISSGTNCSATSTATTVTVNPAPAVPVVTPTLSVCAGQSINLTASSSTPGVTYVWTGPSFLSTSQNPVITNASVANSGVYTVTVQASGCSSSATTTVTVVSGAPALPGTIAGNASVCAGSSQTYTVPNDPAATSYSWTVPAGWTGTSTTNSITATAGSAGGNITVTASNGCGTSSAQTLAVAATPTPTVTIAQSGATLTTTAPFTTYQWYLNGSLITGATSQSYTTTQGGSYHVVVSDGPCSAQSNVLLITAIPTVSQLNTLSLYPSPNNGLFTIKGQMQSANGEAKMIITDVTGRIVYQQILRIESSAIEQNVTLTSVPAGIYMVKIMTSSGTQVLSFVKE